MLYSEREAEEVCKICSEPRPLSLGPRQKSMENVNKIFEECFQKITLESLWGDSLERRDREAGKEGKKRKKVRQLKFLQIPDPE